MRSPLLSETGEDLGGSSRGREGHGHRGGYCHAPLKLTTKALSSLQTTRAVPVEAGSHRELWSYENEIGSELQL